MGEAGADEEGAFVGESPWALRRDASQSSATAGLTESGVGGRLHPTIGSTNPTAKAAHRNSCRHVS